MSRSRHRVVLSRIRPFQIFQLFPPTFLTPLSLLWFGKMTTNHELVLNGRDDMQTYSSGRSGGGGLVEGAAQDAQR